MSDDGFDPRRETLVMEIKTLWSPECGELSNEEKPRISHLVHEDPKQASQIRYIRSHTGFIREITVTPADLDRLGAAKPAGE